MNIPINPTLAQVRAYDECSDLIDNGYNVVFSAITMNKWIIKLRHRSNGRTLKLTCGKSDWFLSDSDRVLKSFPNTTKEVA